MSTVGGSHSSRKEGSPRLADWTIYSWFCPNCREAVAGMKNNKNQIRVKCKMCGAEMIRTIKSRRHNTIEVYAPEDEGLSDYELRRY